MPLPPLKNTTRISRARTEGQWGLFTFLCGLRRSLGGAGLELLYAACSIYRLRNARVEGVRGARYFNAKNRILFAVVPLVGLRRGNGRGNQKALAGCGIFENDRPIVLRMDVLFHVEIKYHIVEKHTNVSQNFKRADMAMWNLWRRVGLADTRPSWPSVATR